MKLIWRWEKKKIPKGLTTLIIENNDRTLRQRKFFRDSSWKLESISSRLSKKSNRRDK